MMHRVLATIFSFALICVLFSAGYAADQQAKPKSSKENGQAEKAKAEKSVSKAEEEQTGEKDRDTAESETRKTLEIDLKSNKKVYFGKVDQVTEREKIRVIKVRKVFSVISHYKRIKKDRIPHGSARYWIYLARANKQFKQAVRVNGEEMKLQLIVECGNIKSIDSKALTAKQENAMDVTDIIVRSARGAAES